jgi:hypothetical protein
MMAKEHLAKPEIWQSAALCWLIDSLALAGAGMAGVHVSDLLDPSNVSGNQTRRKDRPDQRVLNNNSFAGRRMTARSKPQWRSPLDGRSTHRRSGEAKS